MRNQEGILSTIDHEVIQRWVQERHGRPAQVKPLSEHRPGQMSGLLRINFGDDIAYLEDISWDNFFKTFDARRLIFLYQNDAEKGEQSTFYRIIPKSEMGIPLEWDD